MEFLATSLLELITQTSTNLPPDVRQAMSIAAGVETPGTQSSQALDIILSNIDMAVEDEGPICQDTGMPTFFVHTPVGVNQIRPVVANHLQGLEDHLQVVEWPAHRGSDNDGGFAGPRRHAVQSERAHVVDE